MEDPWRTHGKRLPDRGLQCHGPSELTPAHSILERLRALRVHDYPPVYMPASLRNRCGMHTSSRVQNEQVEQKVFLMQIRRAIVSQSIHVYTDRAPASTLPGPTSLVSIELYYRRYLVRGTQARPTCVSQDHRLYWQTSIRGR